MRGAEPVISCPMASRRVKLFHGTTASRAELISRQGWRASALDELVRDCCMEHSVDFDAVWTNLEERRRFVTHAQREGWVSFATSLEKADRWAQRGPEWLWEALEAIGYVRERHDWHDGFPPTGHAWRFEQVAHDPIAIIEVELDLALLHHGGFKSNDSPPLTESDLDLFHEMRSMGVETLPDVRARLPLANEHIIEVHPRPRRVYVNDALGLLQATPEKLRDLDESGALGPVLRDGPMRELTWLWEHVERALTR